MPSNIWGLAPMTSLEGSFYYMTFNNNLTRKIWIYFLNYKLLHLMFLRNEKFCFVESETWLKIKCLWSDSSGKHELNESKEFSATNEIRMKKTTIEAPHQNSMTECMSSAASKNKEFLKILNLIGIRPWNYRNYYHIQINK